MKRVMVGALGITLFVGVASAEAQQELSDLSEWLSGNVTVTSDYAFRGISQTLEEPSVQGGVDLAHPSGFYIGTWGSSLNFGEEVNPRAQVELDVYGGFAFSPADLVDLDLGVLYYGYPGSAARGYDFVEFGLGASRSFSLLESGLTLAYSPDYFGGSGGAWYYGLELGVPVSLLTVGGSIGHQTIEKNEIFGTPNYTNWSLGLGVDLAGFQLSGQYVGTDLDEADCFGGSDLCGGRAIFSISRGM